MASKNHIVLLRAGNSNDVKQAWAGDEPKKAEDEHVLLAQVRQTQAALLLLLRGQGLQETQDHTKNRRSRSCRYAKRSGPRDCSQFLTRGGGAEAWEAVLPSVISCSSGLDHSHDWLRGKSPKLESKPQAHAGAGAAKGSI